MNTLPDYKRRALETRRDALLEEHEAATTQLTQELNEINRKRLERQIAGLEQQIEALDAQLSGAPAIPMPSPTTSPDPEPPALQMARRALSILETQASAYAGSEIPVHLRLNLEEKRKEVAMLESRWRAGQV